MLVGISNFQLSKKMENEIFIPHTDPVNKFLQCVATQIYTVVVCSAKSTSESTAPWDSERSNLSGQY